MNFKQLGSLLLMLLAIFLIVHGLSSLHETQTPKTFSKKVSDFFTDNPLWNPLIEFFGGTPISEKTPPVHYKSSALISIALGGILLLTSIFSYFAFRKKMQT